MTGINPRISIDGTEMKITSRIRFKMLPESKGLAEQLIADRKAQLLPAGPNDLYLVWPLNLETAVMEITHFGGIADCTNLLHAHQMHAQAQLDLLGMIAGWSSFAEGPVFDAAGPVR